MPVGWGDRAGTQLLDAFILFVPIFGAIQTLMRYGGIGAREALIGVLIFIPALGGYLLAETLLGWTPGRRLRGLRLLDVAGERPPRWRLLVRSALRIGWLVGFFLLVGQALGTLAAHVKVPEYIQAGEGWALPVLAVTALYLTSLGTPDRRPLHDYLTGISWYQRRAKAEVAVVENVELAKETGKSAPGTLSLLLLRCSGGWINMNCAACWGKAVWERYTNARDTLLERRVALKVLTSSINVTPTVLRRFEREARLAAQLSHPNIAQVFGVGEVGGQPYMVMEFVSGEDLQKYVQREGPLPLARAWEYVRQTALAFREARPARHRPPRYQTRQSHARRERLHQSDRFRHLACPRR